MKLGNTLFLLLALHFVLVVHAATRLRKGPSASSKAGSTSLQGSVVVNELSSDARRSSRQQKRVAWRATQKRDIVTWYDLEGDDVVLGYCNDKQATLFGNKLDVTDFVKGAVLVIDTNQWGRYCQMPAAVRGISQDDQVLFFEIMAAYAGISQNNTKAVTLKTKRISGQSVIPEVQVWADKGQGKPVSNVRLGEIEIFKNNAEGETAHKSLRGSAVSTDALFGRATRYTNESSASRTTKNLPGISLDGKTDLFAGATLEYQAGADVVIENFRFGRVNVLDLDSIELKWDQSLVASASVEFELTKLASKSVSKRLLSEPVPKFGFEVPIPNIPLPIPPIPDIPSIPDIIPDIPDIIPDIPIPETPFPGIPIPDVPDIPTPPLPPIPIPDPPSIPCIAFCRSVAVPFVGSVKVGAFVRLDALFEFSSKASIRFASSNVAEFKQSVTAKPFSGHFSASPINTNKKPIATTNTFEATAQADGFVGLRPAVAIEVNLGKKQQAGCNIGADMGIEASMRFSGTKTPFPPLRNPRNPRNTFGICRKCHFVQGSVDAVVKDLTLQTEVKSQVKNEISLTPSLFNRKLATVCLVESNKCGRPIVGQPRL